MAFLSNVVAWLLLLLNSSLVRCAPTSSENLVERANKFAHVDQRLFNIDGKTQYFSGTNAWWLGHLFDDQDVDAAASEIAATGLEVVRVWGFGNTNDAATTTDVYYQVLNSSGQYFNLNPENGVPRLDAVVAAAEYYGFKLVLNFLNNFDDLGGINTYTNAYGGNATSFYTNAAAQKAYQNYIKFIVKRYKSSTAIFAWELCNEPRCRQCDTSVIYNWASATSAFIKSLDANHMVTIGDEGWLTPPQGDGSYAYSGYEGVDFIKNLGIPTVDYGTFHLYPDLWGYGFDWGNTWIQQHNDIGKAAGKPVVLEEYAAPYNKTAIMSPWQQTIIKNTSIAYDSFWQFGTQLPVSGQSPSDTYSIFYGTSDYSVLATQHAAAMKAKNGGSSALVVSSGTATS